MSAIEISAVARPASRMQRVLRFAKRNQTLMCGAVVLAAIVLLAVIAPWLVRDPTLIDPTNRLRGPGGDFLLGTDSLGRDILARSIYGARSSLTVGLGAVAVAVTIGLPLGLVAGYVRRVESAIMRLMDALMAIPAIMLAIALVGLSRPGLAIVVIAIAIPEVPRVTRLVRSVVLTVRNKPYIDAAVVNGSSTAKIIWRHILPSTLAPLIVQATYVCASSILLEAALSFLGAGLPSELPSWGNMISSSRMYLTVSPWSIFAPSIALALTVMAINVVGDGLRDNLDPRISRRM